MNLTIKRTDKGFLLSIPLSLKDSLKRSIPSATFCKESESWWIGPNLKRHLDAWVKKNRADLK